MLPDLRTKLYNALKTVHSSVFFVEAPATVVHPYIVFSQVTGAVRWDTMHKDEEEYIQINGYGKSLSALETIRDGVRNLLDNNPGALILASPNRVYGIDEQLNRVAKLGDIWQFTLQFKITIQKS